MFGNPGEHLQWSRVTLPRTTVCLIKQGNR